MTALRSAAFNLLFFAWTALVALAATPLMALPRGAVMAMGRLWAAGALWLLRRVVGLDYEIRGDARLLQRPGIIAAKHQSAWDTFIFHRIARNPTYVMKRELMAIPFYGWVAWRQGSIPVDRKGGGAALRVMMRAARAALGEGRQIVIFPQGTRVPPGTPHPYQPGIAALYAQLRQPVVPIALNSGVFWGRRSFLKRPGRIVVEVLPEIPPGLPRATFMETLERQIEEATARLEAQAKPVATS
ncbi:MAG: 1-acyl-sn-glycerol-3-phosphate acyltransferase [Proteobacteria bacterium]|nr:1-acyl-sn-glycerol-3-phosphate acyltransferase [Pseudomonadota bacterium]